MKTVLITGAKGFIGRNLVAHLRTRADIGILEFETQNTDTELRDWAQEADVIVHLAGVNRPTNEDEFTTGNTELTARLCRMLRETGRSPQIIASSSIQAEFNNPYGISKRGAEQALQQFASETGAKVAVFRLKNVFGKWCRPNYNSVVATFCHNIATDQEIQISDPNRSLELAYIDDVVAAFLAEIDRPQHRTNVLVTPDLIPTYCLTLADLAGRIQFFHEMPRSLRIADFSIRFNQQLYATYLSYVAPLKWQYGLDVKRDPRGSLAEFVKSQHFGQIFVSRTLPGVTRGNHFHHTKSEKFFVVQGEGLIRFRHVQGTEVFEHHVRGEDYRVVNIPPGFTHSIKNVGEGEMITLFWASEIFDPDRPDTYFLPVDLGGSS